MNARIRKILVGLRDAFWLIPGAMVGAGIAGAVLMLELDRSTWLPSTVGAASWVYNGGGVGARTLLGAIASSMIGVAGTVFSITIAALSLAAGQMGPRLLRNFTRDRGNQVTLGAFLGTFSYALMVLRSVRTEEETIFTPHLSLTVGLVLAFACVATLVYFVGHMASRINVDTVVDLVSMDVHAAIEHLTAGHAQAAAPAREFWSQARPIVDTRRGYLHQIDAGALADWAASQGTAILLLRRCGDYIFPGAPIALMTVPVAGAALAIRGATALGNTRGGANDVEDAVRQLVEVAVRALSPGINDPHTAMSVLDRLGAALCGLAGHQLRSGIWVRNDVIALEVPTISYQRLVDLMLHMIRQNAAGSTAILIRMLDVLTQVASSEPDPDRRAILAQHAGLICLDAEREIANSSDLKTILQRSAVLQSTIERSPLPRMQVAQRATG